MYSQIEANKRKTWIVMAVFLLFIYGLAWLFGNYIGDPSVSIIVLVMAVAYAIFSYFNAHKMAASMFGAKPIEFNDNPTLYRIVENLAITNGLPTPKIYIIEDPALNAFASGRDPEHALVGITTGLLEKLDKAELEGVMAHELGHIQNYDTRLNMIAFALVTVIAIISDIFLRMYLYGGGRRDDNRGSGAQITAIIAIVAAILAPIAATMLQLAVSRQREYLADATGALTTRYPEGLANALKKIATYGSTLKKQYSSASHLFIANPLKPSFVARLFSTHPPIEDRIKRLEEMGKKL